ncbi:MAG: hypothetical protein ACXW33_09740, partial [Sulfuricurvum sp.]
MVTFFLLTGCGGGESGAAPLAAIQLDKPLSSVCAGVFPDVLSSEQLIRFEETAKIEGSGEDLRTPILEGSQGRVLLLYHTVCHTVINIVIPCTDTVSTAIYGSRVKHGMT